MSQTQFTDLLDLNLGKDFSVASRLLDIRNQAERIANQANDKQIANGEFATMFAENIKDWMNDIANVADNALASHLETNAQSK
jgi:hypothetical protein